MSAAVKGLDLCGSPEKNSAVPCTRWVTLDRVLIRASLTEETMRQTILEMVRLARERVLGLLLLADKPNLHQEVNDVPQADRQDFLLMRVVRLFGAVHVRVHAISPRRPQESLNRTSAGCESDCQDGGDVEAGGATRTIQGHSKWLCRLTTGGLAHAEVLTMSERSLHPSLLSLLSFFPSFPSPSPFLPSSFLPSPFLPSPFLPSLPSLLSPWVVLFVLFGPFLENSKVKKLTFECFCAFCFEFFVFDPFWRPIQK